MKPANLSKKTNKLKKIIQSFESLLVAFSGGVDSTLLLKISVQILGKEKVLAVIAQSETYPLLEIKAAIKFCRQNQISFRLIKTNELKDPNFISNPKERCYYCKKELFHKLNSIADQNQFAGVCDGSNFDDLSDFRPGSKAKKELGIISPLQEAGFTKSDIRRLSRQMKLKTWDKPSFACLSSRIPYGTKITDPILKQIGKAEAFLFGLGFKQLRVRYHGNIARIEVDPKAMGKIILKKEKIIRKFKDFGFNYTTLDLTGYRTGSMNEIL